MSTKGKLDMSKSTEEEGTDCNGTKIAFNIFNSLFWLISVGIVGLASWQAAGSSAFTQGTAKFTYSILVVSVLSFVLGIVGFLGSLFNHLKLFYSYVVMFVLLILTETILIVVAYLLYPTAIAAIEQIWSECGSYMKEATESNLNCCGFSSWNDTYSSIIEIPEACVNGDDNTIHSSGCGEAVLTYFTSSAVFPIFLVMMCLSAAIQLAALLTGGLFLHMLRKEAKEDGDKSSKRTHSRNTVVPVVMTPVETTSKSAASGGDVEVNVAPTAEKVKGNEALFRVASVMLDY